MEAPGKGVLFGFVFVIPALLGLLSAVISKQLWVARLFEPKRKSPVHPIASAWDWKFNNLSECWVRIKLKDGVVWAGRMGNKSFVSSSLEERDLYLEDVYVIETDSVWTKQDSGVLITHDQIASIEFLQQGAR